VGEAAIYGYRVLRHASGCSRFDNAWIYAAARIGMGGTTISTSPVATS
jgi:hypothetical protein